MTRTKVVLIVSFLLVFAAGTALGVLITRFRTSHRHRSWLTAELKLTPDQQDQIRKIWSETMRSGFGKQSDRRKAAAQERNQATLSLLSEDQRSRYDAIQQEYGRKIEELSQERKRAFEDATQRTKRILTPEQALKYDELLKTQRMRGMGEFPSGFRGTRHRHAAPSSEPTTDTQSAPRGEE